ncbi:MAG: pyrroline-5-carboxylate reductase [Planctomycetes bacterium]|nr:pyrroline-5-carboxylate reductase [Planctomycetota bacterium]
MSEPLRIGFLGAGKMATALAQGWIKAGLTTPDRLCASDPVASARDQFAMLTGAFVSGDNAQIVTRSNILVLAVKPQNMAEVLAGIRPTVSPAHLLISIAAGVTMAQIAGSVGAEKPIIRVMPNTPCLVGASASAFAASQWATAADVQRCEQLFNSVGRAVQVPEKLLDAVTGLSGSGPAYVAVIIEALADGGVRMGLPRDLAMMLAAQTVLGSAQMLLETGLHPGQLKDMVASPAGTTIAGLHELERGGLRAALMDAVEAATIRSMELGKSS